MIRYHGLPMTPVLAMLRSLQGKHAMVSYEHPEQAEEAAEVCQSIVLDNGAYSAWRQGKPHDFAGYKDWCAHWLKHPSVDWCVIPDVIDGDEFENDKLIAKWLLEGERLPIWQSVPVFHMHESMDRLKRLVHAYPRVALGSSGRYATPGTPAWWSRIAEMMQVICDENGYPKTRLHGLRMLDPVIFSHIPLSSADSCNVSRNIGFDTRWDGPYAPASKTTRAIVMIDRIESHATARRWCGDSAGVQQNMELMG